MPLHPEVQHKVVAKSFQLRPEIAKAAKLGVARFLARCAKTFHPRKPQFTKASNFTKRSLPGKKSEVTLHSTTVNSLPTAEPQLLADPVEHGNSTIVQ